MLKKIVGLAAIIIMLVAGYRYFNTTGNDKTSSLLIFIAMIFVFLLTIVKVKKSK